MQAQFTVPTSMGGFDLGNLSTDAYLMVYTSTASQDKKKKYVCSTKLIVHPGSPSASLGFYIMIGLSVVLLAGLGARVHQRRRTAPVDPTEEKQAMLGEYQSMDDTDPPCHGGSR